MNKQDFINDIIGLAREAFNLHRAELLTPTHLLWKRPDSGIYRAEYIIERNRLIVFGDVDEAIYAWSSAVTWDFLAGCSLSYFREKCQASPVGRMYEAWDGDVARDYVNDLFREDERGRTRRAAFRERGGDEAIDDEREFYAWLGENGQEAFGDGWWELSYGKVPNAGCIYHLEGLKMAHEQLALVPA
jgi:hypothetical protein